jgi:hypothetical protein
MAADTARADSPAQLRQLDAVTERSFYPLRVSRRSIRQNLKDRWRSLPVAADICIHQSKHPPNRSYSSKRTNAAAGSIEKK